MRISSTGIELIKRFEGFSEAPYYCPANCLTIGYGHVINKNDADIASKKIIITKSQGEELLRGDLLRFENAVNRLIIVQLKQSQFDALMSFTFNLGEGALQRSTLRSKVNRGEHEQAEAEFIKWVYAGGRRLPGVVTRRTAEARLYAT